MPTTTIHAAVVRFAESKGVRTLIPAVASMSEAGG